MSGALTTTQKTAARVAGAAYALVIIAGIVTEFVLRGPLLADADPSAMAAAISGNEIAFRLSLLLETLMFCGVIVISTMFYTILKPVNEAAAFTAACFRIAEAVVGAALSLTVFAMLRVAVGGDPAVYDALGTLLSVRGATYNLILIFLGFGGIIFYVLFYASRYIPRALSVAGLATYAILLLGAALQIALPNDVPGGAIADMIQNVSFAFGGLFEISLGLWLLIVGVRQPQSV